MNRAALFFACLIIALLSGPSLGLGAALPPAPTPGPAAQRSAVRSPTFTGPDFQGGRPAPVGERTLAGPAWEATLAHRHRFLQALPPENIQVSYSGVVPGASNLINDFSEVMVALDPTDPNHLLGASKFFYDPAGYGFYTGVFESYDAGQTWQETQPAGIEVYSMTSDPVTTFDAAGNGYFTLLTRSPTGLDMLKKPAGGTWLPPVVVDRSTLTDKQWIIGDQDPQGTSLYAGSLYMSWTSFGGPLTGIVFSRSTDGNQTWSAPIAVGAGSVQGSMPGVAPDGTVYVAYGIGLDFGMPSYLAVAQSTDGGASFSPAKIAATITAIPFTFANSYFRTPASLPSFAVSPLNGDLYLAWADYWLGDADIYFSRSVDRGLSWDPPVRLNDDPPANGIDQWQPQIAVAPNGRVSVMWFDRRLPCPALPWIPAGHAGLENFCIDTFMTRSYDRGETWVPNLRASAQTWDWSLNLPFDSQGNGFIGDYQGMAANNEYDYPFWNATANLGRNTENYQQVFIARMRVPASDLSASTKTAWPGRLLPGQPTTYTLRLANAGPLDSSSVVLDDPLPAELGYVSGSLAISAGTGGYDPLTRVITWTGSLAVGQPVTITYQAWLSATLPYGTVISNTAHLLTEKGEAYALGANLVALQPPTINLAAPLAGASAVPVQVPVEVNFSQPMDPASLAISISPDPGGLVPQWSAGNTHLAVQHNPFAYAQAYTITLAAADMDGLPLVPGPVPNPWQFTTRVQLPYVSATTPAANAVEVPLTQTLEIAFNKPVITTSLYYTVTPDPGQWGAAWNEAASRVVLSHAPFSPAQVYTVTVSAQDQAGQPLVAGPAPNPWQFTTLQPSYIAAAEPASGALSVPLTATLVVTFSKAVLPATLQVQAVPDPGGWAASWNETATRVDLQHTAFAPSQTYTVTLAVQDAHGLPLAPGPVPNPWQFATRSLPRFELFLPLLFR